MPKYNKDRNVTITPGDVEAMLARAKNERDRFMVAVLWLTGARVSEICHNLKAKDITNSLENDYFTIRVLILKQGNIKDFHITHRELEISKASPFASIVYKYAEGKDPETELLPIKRVWAWKILNDLSKGIVSPNIFRHNRLTRLSHDGATVDELKSWKGAKDLRSVSPYLQAKPVGRRLVIS